MWGVSAVSVAVGGRTAMNELREYHPEIASAFVLTERFTAMVRERRGEELSAWLADAQVSGIRNLRQFALKMCKDEATVHASCTLRWSNGQAEGQIKRTRKGRYILWVV